MYAQAVGRRIGEKKVMRIFYQLLRTKRPCRLKKIRVGSGLVWDFSFNGWNLPLPICGIDSEQIIEISTFTNFSRASLSYNTTPSFRPRQEYRDKGAAFQLV